MEGEEDLELTRLINEGNNAEQEIEIINDMNGDNN